MDSEKGIIKILKEIKIFIIANAQLNKQILMEIKDLRREIKCQQQ